MNTYTSKSAQLLQSVTATQHVVWTPETGWADESPARRTLAELGEGSARRTQYHGSDR